MLKFLCQFDRLSHVSILTFFCSETCVLSSTSLVCACLVVAWSIVMSRTSATSLITWDMKIDLLSEMIVVGKYACLIMMLIMTLATVLEAGVLLYGKQTDILKTLRTEVAPETNQFPLRLRVLWCVHWGFAVEGGWDCDRFVSPFYFFPHDMSHFVINCAFFG